MAGKKLNVASVGEAYLALLKARGVDYIFANGGTDFAPIIEALARAAAEGIRDARGYRRCRTRPSPIGMAHGYYLATGRPQAVMVHVNVGIANAIMGLINAAREQRPDLLHRRAARRHRIRPCSARATRRSTGARRCATRRACCANSSNGITSCATPIRSKRSSTAR